MGSYLNRVVKEGFFGEVTFPWRRGRLFQGEYTAHAKALRWVLQVEHSGPGRRESSAVLSSEAPSDGLEQKTLPSIPGWSFLSSQPYFSICLLVDLQSGHLQLPSFNCPPSTLHSPRLLPKSLPFPFSWICPSFGHLFRPGKQPGPMVTHNKHFGDTQTWVQIPALSFSLLHWALVSLSIKVSYTFLVTEKSNEVTM